LPVSPPAIEVDSWMRAMGMDKKVQQGELRFVLLKALGDSHITSSYDASRLRQIIGADA
jgi:3-dehydroquinate synthase